MSKTAFLADIGSTFTKGIAVDLEHIEIVCRAQLPTTISAGVSAGFSSLRDQLRKQAGVDSFECALASSSAHGGLKVVAMGLMPELTAQAARMACLNAGARLLACYSHKIGKKEVEEVERIQPDLILLAGGTNGGDRDCVIHNAQKLRELQDCPVILFAGNHEAADEINDICRGLDIYITENVLPELDTLNIEPARLAIRDIFLERIVSAKGLESVAAEVREAIVPTPLAVFNGVNLLSEGIAGRSGRGEIMAADVGGATTDVYSAGFGAPVSSNTVLKGVPEPYYKRTVEGDMGMRISLPGLLNLKGEDWCKQRSSLHSWIEKIKSDTGHVPDTGDEYMNDAVLAAAAAEIAIERHSGVLSEHYSPDGKVLVQKGKDMRGIRQIIAAGGVFACNPHAANELQRKLRRKKTHALTPQAPAILPDKQYVLFAGGLLTSYDQEIAFTLMDKNLKDDENKE